MATGLIPDTTPAHSHDAAYVNVPGDTMTGGLKIVTSTDDGITINDPTGYATQVFQNNGVDKWTVQNNPLGDISLVGGDTGYMGPGWGQNGSMVNSGGIQTNIEMLDQDSKICGQHDSNLLYADASVDRVGIGTNTPSQKLHVVGNQLITGLAGSGSRVVEASATGVLSATKLPDRDLIYDSGAVSGVAEVAVTGIFTSAYRDYEIEAGEIATSVSANLHLRFYLGASPWSAGYYGHVAGGYSTATAIQTAIYNNTTQWWLWQALSQTSLVSKISIKIGNPAIAQYSPIYGQIGTVFSGGGSWGQFGGMSGNAAAFDGIGLFPGGGTMAGRVKIYGVR
jgi:hypothetical protein